MVSVRQLSLTLSTTPITQSLLRPQLGILQFSTCLTLIRHETLRTAVVPGTRGTYRKGEGPVERGRTWESTKKDGSKVPSRIGHPFCFPKT